MNTLECIMIMLLNDDNNLENVTESNLLNFSTWYLGDVQIKSIYYIHSFGIFISPVIVFINSITGVYLCIQETSIPVAKCR